MLIAYGLTTAFVGQSTSDLLHQAYGQDWRRAVEAFDWLAAVFINTCAAKLGFSISIPRL